MDPYLSVIKYLFIKAGFDNNDDSIKSFFDNGYSFPQFIALIFQVDQIPETKKKPYSEYFKKINNDLALQFLFEKNPAIEKLNPTYQTDEDKINLIKLILNTQCFKMPLMRIIDQSNMLLGTIDNQYRSPSDIMNPKFLLSLLSLLTDGSISNVPDLDENNFDIIINAFQKALIPMIINKDSFKTDNQSIYMIQLQIIFDIFTEKIEEIKKLHRIKQTSDKIILLNKFNPEIEITDENSYEVVSEFYKHEDYNEEQNSHDKFITTKENSVKDFYPEKVREEEAILMTIGLIAEELKICKCEDCTSFTFTLFNNFIPLFVMRFLNIEKIENLKTINKEDQNILSHQEVKNIKIVVEYMKKKEKKFELMSFDFDSPHLFVRSSRTFLIAFLNTYFVTKTKVEMMERCNNLLGNLRWYSKGKIFTQRRYDTFAGLLYFIELIHSEDKKLDNTEDSPCFYFNDFDSLFVRTNVPRIIGTDIVDEFYHDSDLPDSLYYQQTDKRLPNSIIYQLQFIFNKIDSLPGLQIVERLMLAKHKIKQIKVPEFDIIESSVKSNIQFLKAKNKIQKIDPKEIEEMRNKEKTLNIDEMTPKTFINRRFDFNLNEISNKNETNEESNENVIQNDDPDNYWNPSDLNYQVDSDILYSNSEPKKLVTEFVEQITKREDKIKKNMNFKKEKKSRKKTMDPGQQNLPLNVQLPKRSSTQNFQSKLYKLFIYDEAKSQWIFDSNSFSVLSNDKKIDVEGSRTPLVFYFNSSEADLVKVNSNLILGSYPSLDQSQIYIYAFCERQLSTLNTTNDYIDPLKAAIKPIFLLLHVPKSKQNHPFIRTAISQIYIYLSNICDLSICLINQPHLNHQVELLQDILFLKNRAFQTKQDKLKIFAIKNNQCAEYDYNYNKEVHNLSLLKMTDDLSLHFYLANFDDFDSFKPFLDKLTDFLLESQTTFSDVYGYFNNLDLSHLSGMYISIYSSISWKDELKHFIEDRFNVLKSNDPNFDKNPEFVLIKLQKEFIAFSPINDSEFQNECNLNYSLMRKTFTKVNDTIIKDELKKSSDENLAVLKKLLNDKNYWTKNQVSNMKNSHIRFLKKEYFSIVRAISDEKLCHFIYNDNLDVLQKQINNDQNEIDRMAAENLKNFKEKNKIKEVNAEESSKKGTNYVLKETENLREIKVTLESIEKLELDIEQDF